MSGSLVLPDYRALFEHAADGMVVVDASMHIVAARRSTAERFTLSPRTMSRSSGVPGFRSTSMSVRCVVRPEGADAGVSLRASRSAGSDLACMGCLTGKRLRCTSPHRQSMVGGRRGP